MSAAIPLRNDCGAYELRVLEGRVKDANQARRLLAIAAHASVAWIGRPCEIGSIVLMRTVLMVSSISSPLGVLRDSKVAES